MVSVVDAAGVGSLFLLGGVGGLGGARLRRCSADAGESVVTIAHRLATIVYYDRVLVLQRDAELEAGALCEYDAPSVLLARADGVFRGMCEATGKLQALVHEAAKADAERGAASR